MNKTLRILSAVTLFAITGGPAAAQTKSTAKPKKMMVQNAVEAKIRALDAEWQSAVTAKDLDRTVSFYAQDAVMLIPGAALARGPDAIRASWKLTLADPNFAVKFSPLDVQADRYGHMAYEIGEYLFTGSDSQGHARTSKGKYVGVWSRQSDGSWKAEVDCPTTTQ